MVNRFLFLLLAAVPAPAPHPWAVTFESGAELSTQLACERVGMSEIKCMDLGAVLRAFARMRDAEAAERQAKEQFKDRLEHGELEM